MKERVTVRQTEQVRDREREGKEEKMKKMGRETGNDRRHADTMHLHKTSNKINKKPL